MAHRWRYGRGGGMEPSRGGYGRGDPPAYLGGMGSEPSSAYMHVQTLRKKGCCTILYNGEYGDVIRNIAYNVSIHTVIHMLYAAN